MARTMSDGQERDIRRLMDLFDEMASGSNEAALLSELDAERAAHGETIASLNQERSAHEETKLELEHVRDANMSVRVCKDHTSEVIGEGCIVCENAALKARLALAEKWAAFGSDCFDAFWCDGEPGDLDAGDMQERALSHGLLRHRTEGDNTLNPDADNCCEHCPCVTEDAPPSECECLFPTLAAWRAAK